MEYNNELYHYGVQGMKWGVRKSAYKSMNRQQRKETRRKYYNTPEGKVKKATTISTVLGGPLVGVVSGSVMAKKVGLLSKKDINKGKTKIDEVKTQKVETDEQKITRLMAEGKIGSNAHHYFDQNGNLMMVTWD